MLIKVQQALNLQGNIAYDHENRYKKFQIVDVHINSNSDALSAASLFKSLCMVDWSLCTCKLLSEAIECSHGAPYESPWAQLFEGRLALNPGV